MICFISEALSENEALNISFLICSLCESNSAGSWIEKAFSVVSPKGAVSAKTLSDLLTNQLGDHLIGKEDENHDKTPKHGHMDVLVDEHEQGHSDLQTDADNEGVETEVKITASPILDKVRCKK